MAVIPGSVKCSTCVFFVPTEQEPFEQVEGRCFRFPPPGVPVGCGDCGRPEVSEQEFCGEHRLKW